MIHPELARSDYLTVDLLFNLQSICGDDRDVHVCVHRHYEDFLSLLTIYIHPLIQSCYLTVVLTVDYSRIA